jgi:hypothetical protein
MESQKQMMKTDVGKAMKAAAKDDTDKPKEIEVAATAVDLEERKSENDVRSQVSDDPEDGWVDDPDFEEKRPRRNKQL